jgi:ribonucleoside-diphosphate reductase alpha chain|tara:strand:+ start:10916 stop:12808 length:1893 start_codon:yes stop_codon:yes gene_type:complete
MMEDKVGAKEYLGIKINYDNEKLLDKFSLDTLKDRYFTGEETHAQEAFARASVFGATFKGVTDFELAQRLYNYSSLCWFMFSTPILSNGGTSRGLPISCFLNYVPDSRTGLSSHYDENIWLASSGGGIGGYWGDVRSNGVSTAHGSKSTGSIPFMHVVDSQMLAFNQGVTRRGSYAAYMNIWHPEIEEFINMRKESGGDINRKCLNLHNGVNLNNEFLQAVENDEEWRLIDPKSNEAIKTINARDLWWQLLNARAETGEPYIVNIDTCNKALPQKQKDLGLEIKQSNLCSEITLPTNEERTAVCCLSSVNLEHFDKWSKDKNFINDLVTMLDNVLQHFIDNAVDTTQLGEYNANFKRFIKHIKEGKEGFTKAVYSAYRERSIGLGAMGFHAYLQSKEIPFESMYATSFNHKAFKYIKTKAVEASQGLAESRGEAPDISGSGLRNAHLLAVAPNASSSIICGGTSPSIEPYRANVYTHKTLSGSYQVKNKYLEKLLKAKGLKGKKLTELWKEIAGYDGSVQHLDILTAEEKELFKTANEINQIWIIEHAYKRQDFICQSQSVNLFFILPKATEPQEVHDDYMQYVNDVHWYGACKLKSLYYFRSNAARNAENVNVKIPRIKLDEGCIACEG